MSSGNQMVRNDYSVAASQNAQANFEAAASRLVSAWDRRDSDVKPAIGRYQADGVSEEYADLERRWNMGGHQLREVIGSIRHSLGDNDDIAVRALSTAAAAVPDAGGSAG